MFPCCFHANDIPKIAVLVGQNVLFEEVDRVKGKNDFLKHVKERYQLS